MAQTMSMTTTRRAERISGDPRETAPRDTFASVAELGDWLRCATLAVFAPELLLEEERRLTGGEPAGERRSPLADWR